MFELIVTNEINFFLCLEGRKKGKDVKSVTKKKRAASSEDDEVRGNAGNNSQKASKKQKVNQEKDGRKGQKVIIFHQIHFSRCVTLAFIYFFLLYLSSLRYFIPICCCYFVVKIFILLGHLLDML